MGTRNLTIVQSSNDYKVVQYGQFDGYPDGQGLTILEALCAINSFDDFKRRVDNLTQLTDEDVKARWLELGVHDGFAPIEVYNVFEEKWYHLSRSCAGRIIEEIASGKTDEVYCDSINFAGDSLFCEWAYVIDLDKHTFEVYKGLNMQPLSPDERFAGLPQSKGGIEYGYYPIRLIATWSLDALPSVEEMSALGHFEHEAAV